jgi:hypothetical protein
MSPKQKEKGEKKQGETKRAVKKMLSPNNEETYKGPLTDQQSRLVVMILTKSNISPACEDSEKAKKLLDSMKDVKAILKDVPQEQWPARLQNLTQDEFALVRNMVQDYLNYKCGTEWGHTGYDHVASMKRWEMVHEGRFEPYDGKKPVSDPAHLQSLRNIYDSFSRFYLETTTRTVSAEELIARREEDATMTDEKRERLRRALSWMNPFLPSWPWNPCVFEPCAFPTDKSPKETLSEAVLRSKGSKMDPEAAVKKIQNYLKVKQLSADVEANKLKPSDLDKSDLTMVLYSPMGYEMFAILEAIPRDSLDQKVEGEQTVRDLLKEVADVTKSEQLKEAVAKKLE